jgi:hypothetical protein
MTTLVIHPEDQSTDFLKGIYESLDDKTVITGGKTRGEVIELIEGHDRVFMMGHGSPSGLFKVGAFPNSEIGHIHVIDWNLVPYLRGKENLYIWCHADQFVRKHELTGFFSGMFVSETHEAIYHGVAHKHERYGMKLSEMVKESNTSFSKILGSALSQEMPMDDLFRHVLYHYGNIAKENKIANYNHDRLYKAG